MSNERRRNNTVKNVALGEQKSNNAFVPASQELTRKWNPVLILFQWAIGLLLLHGALADVAYLFFSIGESVRFKDYAALMVLLVLVRLLKSILQRLDAIGAVISATHTLKPEAEDAGSNDPY